MDESFLTKSKVLTNTRKAIHATCPAKHHYMFNLGYRPRIEDPERLTFGLLGHVLRERYTQHVLEARKGRGSLLGCHDVIRNTCQDMSGNSDPFIIAKLRPLMIAYAIRWYDEDLEQDTLGVEEEFSYPHTNPETGGISRTWTEAGKVDAWWKQGDKLYFLDVKFTSDDIQPGSIWWKAQRMRSQWAQYYGWKKWSGFMIDAIKRPQLRPYKATPPEKRKLKKDGTLYADQREFDETPDDFERRVTAAIAACPPAYFQRGMMLRTEADVLQYQHESWLQGRKMADEIRIGVHPRTGAQTGACHQYGTLCPFFGVCAGDSELTDPTLFEAVANVHPELKEST